MKITVVSLLYNNYDDLLDTVKSIVSQNFTDFEYVMLDDCSVYFNKKKLALAKKILSKNEIKFSFYENNENQGTVKAFNNAVKFSVGEIIVPLSPGDMFYCESSLNKIANEFECSATDIVTYNSFFYKSIGSLDGTLMPKSRSRKILKLDNATKLKYMLLNGNVISGACTSYRKEAIVSQGYFDESFFLIEDFPFYIKYLLSGKEINYLDDIIVYYKFGGVSTSGFNINMLNDYSKMRDVFLNKYSMSREDYILFLTWYGFTFGSKLKVLIKSPVSFFKIFYNKLLDRL